MSPSNNPIGNSQALIIGCPLDPDKIKWAEIPEIYTIEELKNRVKGFSLYKDKFKGKDAWLRHIRIEYIRDPHSGNETLIWYCGKYICSI